ncbi:RluA family pseudouridine synthase [Halioxenophilus sp. WMMB6]|uniref:RluA family pseudouridine synthase n=1 Tax=Halioxenophilus sp. WMMB6 TaxID=3073815 RepID=UPI00295F0118|nr:RluA family pseudouridine synthase [Halioxenophilus sp. WMMB6]
MQEESQSPKPGAQWVTIDADSAGQRIDNYLLTRLKGVPKSRIYRILRKGEVRINKARVKPEYRLQSGDLIRIPPLRLAERPPVPVPSQSLWHCLSNAILFEDEGLMVVNKPAGIAVHGGDGVSLGLIEAMRQVRSDCPYLELVHRLDKETSGCVMLAKKRSRLRALQAFLRSAGGVDKRYCALVVGAWPEKAVLVDAPLLRMELADGNRIVKVKPDGKPSQTQFRILERFQLPGVGDLTLVEAKPLTGRTHQIRVHAQYLGHPLVGDSKYGRDDINRSLAAKLPLRLCLHAAQLAIPGHEGGDLVVEAPLPGDFASLLDVLRSGN